LFGHGQKSISKYINISEFYKKVKMKADKEWVKNKYKKKGIVKKYNKTRFTHFQGRLNHLMEIKFINEALKKYNIKKILEIAPGTGRIAKELDVNQYIGIDSSEAMLEELKKIKKKGYKFIKGDAFSLPSLKNSVGGIICFRLIRHFKLKERRKLYAEIKRVLKKDGIFIIDASNKERGIFGWVHDFFFRIIFNIVRKDEIIYDKFYTKQELIREIEANGFKVLNIDSVNPNYVFYSPITRFNLKFLGKILLKKAIENNKKNRNSKKCYSWVVTARKN